MKIPPLLAYKRVKSVIENPAYLDASQIDLTKKLFNEFEFRMTHQQNILIEIVGEPGTGKSTAGFILNDNLQKLLGYQGITLNNATMTYSRALKLVQKHKSRWTIQVDEQKRDYFGEGTQRELSALQDLEDIVRQAQVNFIFVAPSPRSFHNGLHFILRTWWINYKTRETTLFIYDGEDKGLIQPLGFIRLTLPKPNENPDLDNFLQDYNQMKTEFIQNVQDQSSRAEYFKEITHIAQKLAKDTRIIEVKKSKKKITSIMYLQYPEIVSKYSITELDRIADLVQVLTTEK